MDVTTELLDNAAFRPAKRGGYNTQDVDEFIEEIKSGVEEMSGQLAELRGRVESADARVAEAERRAAEADARADATGDADDTLKRTLVLAQRTADAAIKEAEEQASRTLSSAQDHAARLLADAQEASARARADADTEARRAHEEARTRVLGELRELEASRDQLQADVGGLERHFAEQRDRLRAISRQLQRLLDDPTALREVAVPAARDVSVTAIPTAFERPAPERPAEAPADAADDRPAWSLDELPPPELDLAQAPPPAAPARAEVDLPREEEQGQPTEHVDMLAERDAGDDAYLAELRKAMTDESPLGPREEGEVDSFFDAGIEPTRSRFGRQH